MKGKEKGTRFELRKYSMFITSIIGVVFGFLVAAIIILFFDVNPLVAYKELFLGAFGSVYGFCYTLMRFIPLACTGLAVTIAFRGGMFNIGAEGQLYISAMAATWVAINVTGLPSIIHIPLAVTAGAVAAGLLAFIPGYLKARRGINEILVTILLNYIAMYLVAVALNTFMMEPEQSIPWSAQIAETSIIPKLLPKSPLHVGIIFVFIMAFVVYFVLWHTTWGYELRSVGSNPYASESGGVRVTRVRIMTIVFSGVLASFAGSMEILGAQFRLQPEFLVNYGYYGIPVALLGGLHPAGTLLAAFFFGALFNGATTMQASTGIPVSIVGMVQALAILGVIGITGIKQVFLANKFSSKRVECDS